MGDTGVMRHVASRNSEIISACRDTTVTREVGELSPIDPNCGGGTGSRTPEPDARLCFF